MLDFLTSIADILSAIVSFVVNIVQGLIFLVTMIPKAMAVITVSYGYMPAMLVGLAVAGIAISVVFLLIGR